MYQLVVKEDFVMKSFILIQKFVSFWEAGAAAEKQQLLQIYNDQVFRSMRVVSSKSIKKRQETVSSLLKAQRRRRNIKKRQCRGRSPQ